MNMARTPNFYETFASSVAPSIFGFEGAEENPFILCFFSKTQSLPLNLSLSLSS